MKTLTNLPCDGATFKCFQIIYKQLFFHHGRRTISQQSQASATVMAVLTADVVSFKLIVQTPPTRPVSLPEPGSSSEGEGGQARSRGFPRRGGEGRPARAELVLEGRGAGTPPWGGLGRGALGRVSCAVSTRADARAAVCRASPSAPQQAARAAAGGAVRAPQPRPRCPSPRPRCPGMPLPLAGATRAGGEQGGKQRQTPFCPHLVGLHPGLLSRLSQA